MQGYFRIRQNRIKWSYSCKKEIEVTAKRVIFAILVMIVLGALATVLYRLSGGLAFLPVI